MSLCSYMRLQKKKNYGLVSMSFSTKLPLFQMFATIIHVESSIGRFLHFTRYSKYSFSLVFFITLLSRIFFGSKDSTTGNGFSHRTTSSPLSSAFFASPSLYFYKSTTLKISEIPTPSSNSISYALGKNFFTIL